MSKRRAKRPGATRRGHRPRSFQKTVRHLHLAIVTGSEGYAPVLELAAKIYTDLVDKSPELHDGQGNAWVVAMAVLKAAEQLNIKAQGWEGRHANDQAQTTWVEFEDGTVIVSPNPERILVGSGEHIGQLFVKEKPFQPLDENG